MARDRIPEGGVTGLPFDDVRSLVEHFPDPDRDAIAATAGRLQSLGDAGELVGWLAGWRDPSATFSRYQINMFISLVNTGTPDVDNDALEEARDLLAGVAGGGHSLSQIALAHGAGLKVYDLALEVPTGDILNAPAMDERECAAAMAFGMEGIAGGADLVAVARAGRGGAVSGAAIVMALYPDLQDMVLAELDQETAEAASVAGAAHKGASADPFELLRRVGSRDMAAIAGVIMAARTQRIPVVLSGVACLAVAAVLERAGAGNIAHCLAAHDGAGVERELVQRLGLRVVIPGDWGLLPGVASGAAIGIVRTAVSAALPLLRQAD